MKQIIKIEHIGKHPVYDIEVSNQHHYVLSNGVLSHNSGLRYAASIILSLTKAKDKEKEDGVDTVVGSIITITAIKSRLTKENSKVQTCLKYSGGLDKYYGLLDLAVKFGLIKKVGTRYEMPDGQKVFGKHINENPEKYWTNDLLKVLDECIKKEFLYGSDWKLDHNETNNHNDLQ